MREISAEGGKWVCGCAYNWEGIRTQDRENLQSLRIDVSQSSSFFSKDLACFYKRHGAL